MPFKGKRSRGGRFKLHFEFGGGDEHEPKGRIARVVYAIGRAFRDFVHFKLDIENERPDYEEIEASDTPQQWLGDRALASAKATLERQATDAEHAELAGDSWSTAEQDVEAQAELENLIREGIDKGIRIDVSELDEETRRVLEATKRKVRGVMYNVYRIEGGDPEGKE